VGETSHTKNLEYTYVVVRDGSKWVPSSPCLKIS